MTYMRPTLPSRLHGVLVPILLLGMIWQLGACPCGCADHNLWLGIYSTLLGEGDRPAQTQEGASVDGHDCDHKPRDAFLRGRTVGDDIQVTATHAAFLRESGCFANRLPLPQACPQPANRSRPLAAQELRAHLQVFLL